MAKSRDSKKPISEEEYTTNKVLAVFSACLGGVLVLMALQRMLNYGQTWRTGRISTLVLLGVGVVGVFWGFMLLAWERSGKRTVEKRILRGRNVLTASLILTACMLAIHMYGTFLIKGMYVLLPVLAVYYLVYHSYPAEFFIIALDCGAAIGLMWMVQRAVNSAAHMRLAYIMAGLAVVLAAVQLGCIMSLRAKKGRYTFKGRKRSARFGKNAYTILIVTPIVMAVLTAAVLFLTSRFLILLGAAAAYLFITAVYYTVKLM